MSAHFTIKGLGLGIAEDETLLGVWQTESGAQRDGFSFRAFSTAEAEQDEPIVWSVSLPFADDTEAAEQLLQTQQYNLHRSQQVTQQAVARLETIPPPELSFNVRRDESPEARLFAYVYHLQQIDEEQPDVSFGVEGLIQGWEDTAAKFETFFSQTLQLLKPTMQVETRLGEGLMAYSHLHLAGDIETTWQGRSSEKQRHLHQQTVSLASQSRVAVLQLLGQISTGAAVLSARFSLPGGPLMALPAAWRYIQDVSMQAQEVAQLYQKLDPRDF